MTSNQQPTGNDWWKERVVKAQQEADDHLKLQIDEEIPERDFPSLKPFDPAKWDEATTPTVELDRQIERRVMSWFGEPVIAVEDEIKALISQATKEAYKKGYIDGGIDTLTKGDN